MVNKLAMSTGFAGVSIPQAVSAVATNTPRVIWSRILDSFNTASGKCCCNHTETPVGNEEHHEFQYRKR